MVKLFLIYHFWVMPIDYDKDKSSIFLLLKFQFTWDLKNSLTQIQCKSSWKITCHTLKTDNFHQHSYNNGYTCISTMPYIILSVLCPSKIFFVTFFSATIDGRNLIFGHKLHIGMPYCGKRFWTRQIPTSCLLT